MALHLLQQPGQFVELAGVYVQVKQTARSSPTFREESVAVAGTEFRGGLFPHRHSVFRISSHHEHGKEDGCYELFYFLMNLLAKLYKIVDFLLQFSVFSE